MVELIPREVLFGNPERISPRLSPDGTRLAWIAPKDGVLNVWLAPVSPQTGVDPLYRTPIPGLHTDAFTLIAEVIEVAVKPAQPWGDRAQAAFGDVPDRIGTTTVRQAIRRRSSPRRYASSSRHPSPVAA